jgi:hypothetical protein
LPRCRRILPTTPAESDPTPIIAANLVLPISRPGDDIEECLDPTNGGELTRRGNREAFDLYAERLTKAAAIVRRVGRAIDGRGVEVAEDERLHIGLTGSADVLQPLIDAGDLERVYPDGEELEWGPAKAV